MSDYTDDLPNNSFDLISLTLTNFTQNQEEQRVQYQQIFSFQVKIYLSLY